MPPNATTANQPPTEVTGVLNECDAETIDGGLVKDITQFKRAEKRKLKLVWRNIIAFAYLHVAAVYGLWLALTSAKWATVGFGKRKLEIAIIDFKHSLVSTENLHSFSFFHLLTTNSCSLFQ